MSINGLSYSIDNNGITLQGTLFGSTRPDLSPLLNDLPNDTRLIIHAKPIFISEQINSNTNPNLLLPIQFGDNKYILSINGDLYAPEMDFDGKANNLIWKNERTIQPTDEVVAWGAGNSYTGNNLTIEPIDLKDPTVYTPGVAPIIKLKKSVPYDVNSIYFVIDSKAYSPGIDFAFNISTNSLTWLKQSTIPIDINFTKAFAFYYNTSPLQPFSLGQVLQRIITTVETNNQAEFNIAALPKTNLNTGSNLFYEKKRYSYSTDYSIISSKIFTQNPSKLKTDLVSGRAIDISFFKDQSLYSPIIESTIVSNAGTSQNPGDSTLYRTPIIPAGIVNPTNIRRLLYVNGLYLFGEVYNNGNLASIAGGGIGPEYYLNSNFIEIDSDARNTVNPFIPNINTTVELVQYTDILSQSHVNIEYFKRTAGQTTFSLQKNVKGGKAFVLYNGETLFVDFGQFNINSTNKNVIENIIYPDVMNTSLGYDDIAVFYISDDAVANLFYFDVITIPVDINWDSLNNTISSSAVPFNLTFGNNIISKNNTMLFRNGVKVHSSKYDIVPNSPKDLRFNNTQYFRAGDSILLVHN